MLKITIIRNNLSYQEFRNELIRFKVFSVVNARIAFPQFDSRRLVEWQQRGYIRKLINKWYVFAEEPITEHLLYRISNCLHHPSYVSLESALSYYQLIPEQVFTQQAVSTRKTVMYHTPVGSFNYRTIKPSLYFGYRVIQKDGLPILMADLEKTILDYFYLNSSVQSREDMQSLRWNLDEIGEKLNWETLYTYLAVFHSTTLEQKINLFKKNVLNAHTATN